MAEACAARHVIDLPARAAPRPGEAAPRARASATAPRCAFHRRGRDASAAPRWRATGAGAPCRGDARPRPSCRARGAAARADGAGRRRSRPAHGARLRSPAAGAGGAGRRRIFRSSRPAISPRPSRRSGGTTPCSGRRRMAATGSSDSPAARRCRAASSRQCAGRASMRSPTRWRRCRGACASPWLERLADVDDEAAYRRSCHSPAARCSLSRGISSTRLHGRWRLSSWCLMMSSQPSRQAPGEPGSAKR